MSVTPLSNRVSTTGLAILTAIALGWFLHQAQSILVPIVLGALLALLMEGIARLLDRVPLFSSLVPAWLKMALTTVLLFVMLTGLLGLFARNLEPVVRAIPTYVANLDRIYLDFAARFDIEITATFQSVDRLIFDNINLQKLIRLTLNSVSYTAGYLALVFLYAILFLIERESIATKVAAIVPDARTQRNVWVTMDLIARQIGTYFMTKTLINVVLGLVSWGILWYFGVEFAAFFAVLTAIFNYIPYVGSVFAVALPMLVVVGSDGLSFDALMLLACLSTVQFGVGYLFEPRLMGRSMNLSPVVVMVSLASWAALWGPIGAILSVVLTSGLMTVMSFFRPTRPIAILLTNNGEVPSTEDMLADGTASK